MLLINTNITDPRLQPRATFCGQLSDICYCIKISKFDFYYTIYSVYVKNTWSLNIYTFALPFSQNWHSVRSLKWNQKTLCRICKSLSWHSYQARCECLLVIVVCGELDLTSSTSNFQDIRQTLTWSLARKEKERINYAE